MRAEDLLLTEDEQRAAKWAGWEADDALCRAQVAKVLAALLQKADRCDAYDMRRFVNAIIAETSLTWPLKEV